jgi:hypothetical protein
MTTSNSPLRVLKQQADRIAKLVKAVERGENPIEDRGGRIAAARDKPSVKFGIAMDDKFLTLDMSWTMIRATSEVALSEYVLKQMRGNRDALQ